MRTKVRLRALGLIAALASAIVPSAILPVGAAPGPGYFASDNVEFISTMPLHTDAVGAELVGKFLYVTTERDLTIYDVSNATQPQRVGQLVYLPPQEYYFPEEDVDTNGKVLLYGAEGTLNVVDVRDKANPQVIGSVEGADEHTVTCVLDCTYAYGSEGVIVDLRKPTAPKIVGDWSKLNGRNGGHDVTEVAPGLIMTSSRPLMLLDARKDPAHPKVLAVGVSKDNRFIHGNLWPRGMKDKFLLVGGETRGPQCDTASAGAFMTWDATKWRESHSFSMIDEFRVKTGLPLDGNSPANQYCAHWFDEHPTWRNGGLLAMAWYEHGTRFLNVSSNGKIKETGYFLPVGGSTSAAYWITDRVLYLLDYNRGLDIIRYTGKL